VYSVDVRSLDRIVEQFRKKPVRTSVLFLAALTLLGLGVYFRAFLQKKGEQLADGSPAEPLDTPRLGQTRQPPEAPLAEQEELVRVLERRAERVLEYLDQEQQNAIAAIDRPPFEGHTGTIDNPGPRRTGLQQRLADIRAAFLRLHRQHVEAIKNGNLILAHELVLDIHYLLWVENRDIFYGTRTNPNVAYMVDFPPPDTYAALYPGSAGREPDEPFVPKLSPHDAKGTAASKLDPDRLKRIEGLIVAASKDREHSK